MSKAQSKTTTRPTITIQDYRRNKRKLIKEEQANFDHITIIPCSGQNGWYEIADHSALIYYYEICKRLQLSTKFHSDTDSPYLNYKIGYIRTCDIDKIRANIKDAKLYQRETHHADTHTYVFYLNTAIPIDQMQKYAKSEEIRRNKMGTQITTYNLDPRLYQLITSAGARLNKIIRATKDRPSIGVYAKDIQVLIMELLQNYHRLTFIPDATSPTFYQILQNMRANVHQLIVEVQALYDFRLRSSEVIASISTPLFQIRNIIENKLTAAAKASAKSADDQKAKQDAKEEANNDTK